MTGSRWGYPEVAQPSLISSLQMTAFSLLRLALQVHLVHHTLDTFCNASGLKINIQKSKFVTSKNVSKKAISLFGNISGFTHTNNIDKYLGFPILVGQVKNKEFSFIMDQINSRLAGWKAKLLNRAGRVTLAKFVLNSITIYAMQNLWLLEGICDSIDKATRAFIWGKPSTHWVNWEIVTKPKKMVVWEFKLLGKPMLQC